MKKRDPTAAALAAEARLRADELALMRNPVIWPRWPYLPLMRRGQDADPKACGVLFDDATAIVYFGNICMLPETIKQMESIAYPSFEALSDEWRVD